MAVVHVDHVSRRATGKQIEALTTVCALANMFWLGDHGCVSLPSPARARLLALAVTILAALAVLAPAEADAALVLRPAGATGAFGNELLSNERTLTRHAKARYESPIYRFPNGHAQRIVNLRFMTEDGYPEVYIVLQSFVDSNGQVWFKIRIPGRPNGRVGWVRDYKLGDLKIIDTFAHVRRGRDLRLYRGSTLLFQAPVGTGAPATPTPAGHFWIREKFNGPGGIYGPRVFGTADYSVLSEWPRGGVIGIHGTDEPGLIPGRPSHGCIRMRNADILRLYGLMPVGTPLLIT
jgi:hypothetical protein